MAATLRRGKKHGPIAEINMIPLVAACYESTHRSRTPDRPNCNGRNDFIPLVEPVRCLTRASVPVE